VGGHVRTLRDHALHLLARNIMRDLATDSDEEFQLHLRVDGLDRRELACSTTYEFPEMFLLRFGSHAGTVASFYFPLRTTLRAVELDAVRLAKERCERVLWTFVSAKRSSGHFNEDCSVTVNQSHFHNTLIWLGFIHDPPYYIA